MGCNAFKTTVHVVFGYDFTLSRNSGLPLPTRTHRVPRYKHPRNPSQHTRCNTCSSPFLAPQRRTNCPILAWIFLVTQRNSVVVSTERVSSNSFPLSTSCELVPIFQLLCFQCPNLSSVPQNVFPFFFFCCSPAIDMQGKASSKMTTRPQKLWRISCGDPKKTLPLSAPLKIWCQRRSPGSRTRCQ